MIRGRESRKSQADLILNSADKHENQTAGGPSGSLAGLFRRMLVNLDISPTKYNRYMEAFLVNSHNGIPNNPKARTMHRGNMNKELLRDTMTWRVFCRALRFLEVVKFQITIKAWHMNGKTSLHSKMVGLSDPGFLLDETNEEDTHEANVTSDDEAPTLRPTAHGPGIYIDHYYVWNRTKRLVYQDIGKPSIVRYTRPQDNAAVITLLAPWRTIDADAEVVIGLVIEPHLTRWYRGEKPEGVTDQTESPALEVSA